MNIVYAYPSSTTKDEVWSTGAFLDLGVGAGAAIKKLLKIFLYSEFNFFYIKKIQIKG